MKTTRTFTLSYNPTAQYAGIWNWTSNGLAEVSGTLTRRGQRLVVENLVVTIRGANDANVDGQLSVNVHVSVDGSDWSARGAYATVAAQTYTTKVIPIGDISMWAYSSATIQIYLYASFAASDTGTIFRDGVTNEPLPAYTPPTYGSVNGQSEFIDTLYGSASWSGYTPSSITATSIAGLVTDWNAYGGSTIDAKGVQRHPNLMAYKKDSSNIYLLLAYPKYSLDHNNWSNSTGVWKYVTIPRLQFGSILCDKDSTQGGFKDAITSSSSTWQNWANSAATGDFTTLVRFAGNNVSVKLDKLYGSVNGVAKRIY